MTDSWVGGASTRTWLVPVFVGSFACSGPGVHVASGKPAPPSSPGGRLENLQRAARLPWIDEGACAVREASGEWGMLVERCYHALDLSRIQFRDVNHRCSLATTNVAVVQVAVGICLLAALELAAEAVIV